MGKLASLPDEASGRNVVEIVFVLPVFVIKCLHSHHPMSLIKLSGERNAFCAFQFSKAGEVLAIGARSTSVRV